MTKTGTNPALNCVTETPEPSRTDAFKVRSLPLRSPYRFKAFTALTGIVVAAVVLAGCQPKSSSPSASATPGTAETTTGTGDSGGGNGLNGKFFESYAINPVETPEWKSRVAPIIENLSKVSSKVHVDYSPLFSLFARARNWYVAPVKLASLTKKSVGVDFIQDPMQQHALQTAREVWIEKSFWDGASQDERGLGLLHEAVMGVYQQQFMTIYELCVELRYQSKEECAVEKRRSSRMDPKPKRTLTETDYANIRKMTSWLSEHGASETDGSVVHREFMRNGFDPRMSEPFVEGHENAPLEFKADEYFRRLADASVGRRVPKFCRIARGGRIENAKCDVVFNLVQNGALNGLGLRVEIAAIPGFSEKRILRGFEEAEGYWRKDSTVQLYARDLPTIESNEVAYVQGFGTGEIDGQNFEVGTDVYAFNIYLAKTGLSVRAISAAAQRVARIGRPHRGVVDVDFISPAQDEREYIEITDEPVEGRLVLSDSFRESRFTVQYRLPLNPRK